MEYAMLMEAVQMMIKQVQHWLATAEEIREAEKAGPVSDELRATARKALLDAQAAAHALGAPMPEISAARAVPLPHSGPATPGRPVPGGGAPTGPGVKLR